MELKYYSNLSFNHYTTSSPTYHAAFSSFLLLELLKQLGEFTSWVLHQGTRTIILLDTAETQDKYFVTRDDGIKSVGDSQHG